MASTIEIEFEQLISIVKKLSPGQWLKLKSAMEERQPSEAKLSMSEFLLQAPVFSKQQIDTISETRKKLIKWRTK